MACDIHDREGKSPSPVELRLERMSHGSATGRRRQLSLVLRRRLSASALIAAAGTKAIERAAFRRWSAFGFEDTFIVRTGGGPRAQAILASGADEFRHFLVVGCCQAILAREGLDRRGTGTRFRGGQGCRLSSAWTLPVRNEEVSQARRPAT